MKSNIKTILFIACIIGAAGLAAILIYSSEPEAERQSASRETAILVTTEILERGSFTPRIEGLGTVEAARDIMLSARVSGQVQNIADSFMPGGFVSKGDYLLQIDSSDYRNAVRTAESQLRQTRSDLSIEEGRQSVAQRELELLGETLGNTNRSLVLRQPQFESAQAAVQSAQAALEQARLDLSRTNVTAPFDAQIIERQVNIGSQVENGMMLARLIGVDEYWVTVSVPVAKLDRIALPDGNNDASEEDRQAGAKVIIRNRSAWPDGATRIGYVQRLIGALDGQTRLARIVTSVKDPLSLDENSDAPKMIVGTIVQAEIEGRPIENVFRIDRDYIRENNTLWLKRDDKLVINQADVMFQDKNYAYVTDGAENGDELVTSNLSTVAEGVALRTQEEGESGPPEDMPDDVTDND